MVVCGAIRHHIRQDLPITPAVQVACDQEVAIANFRMAQCYEKLDQPDQAIPHYQEYLKILPEGPLAKDAHSSLARLGKAQ